MKTFSLTIVSDSKIIFSGQAVYCSVVTPRGSMGFEANHEPFMAILKKDSEIEYRDKAGNKKSVMVQSGILSFENNTCTVTVQLTK